MSETGQIWREVSVLERPPVNKGGSRRFDELRPELW